MHASFRTAGTVNTWGFVLRQEGGSLIMLELLFKCVNFFLHVWASLRSKVFCLHVEGSLYNNRLSLHNIGD